MQYLSSWKSVVVEGADMPVRRAATILLSVALAFTVGPLPAAAKPGGSGTGASHSLRAPVTDENFYFVMADRFDNGDTATTPAAWAPTRWSPASIPPARASTTEATSRACSTASTTSAAWAPRRSG